MYKVYFEELFFIGLDDFISSMEKYYYNFYSNTGLYNVNEIIEGYITKYDNLKTDILNEIFLISESGILGRKVLYQFDNIENCIYMFHIKRYKIIFTAIKNDKEKEVIVSTIKIEI